MKITFVIPAYNIEGYIRQCIGSILAIRSVDREIILVLGNSSDKTNLICKESQKKHPEIVIINQDGAGLSNARNCGLKQTTGDYVIFVDGDDRLRSEALEKHVSLLEKSPKKIDMLVSDFISLSKDNKVVNVSQQIPLCGDLKTDNAITLFF